MTRARTILVGAGKVGAGFADDPVMARHYPYASHAQVLAEHPRVEWGAVVDVDPAVTSRVQERWGVAHAGRTVAEACVAYAPEIAVIATPPDERLRVLAELPTVRAVLVEKPLGLDEAASRAFLDACRERDVLVLVNIWRRADERLRQIARERDAMVGRVQTAFVTYGNGLHNNGTHMIDLVRMLLGEITRVRSAPESLTDAHGPIPGDVHVAATLTLESGLTVHLAPLDFREYRENGIDVWGTHGRVSVYQEGLSTSVYPRVDNRAMTGEREIASDTPTRLDPTCGRAFWAMYDNLFAALDGHAEPCSTGESAMRTTRVVDLVERSAREDGASLSVDGGG